MLHVTCITCYIQLRDPNRGTRCIGVFLIFMKQNKRSKNSLSFIKCVSRVAAESLLTVSLVMVACRQDKYAFNSSLTSCVISDGDKDLELLNTTGCWAGTGGILVLEPIFMGETLDTCTLWV